MFVELSDNLYKGITASTATGSEMQTYGRLVLPLRVGDRNYVISPVVADIADDGILRLDFAALYGITLDPRSGVLTFELPSRSEVQSELKRISSMAVVAQTCKIPAGHMCNVLVRTDGLESNRMGVVEPDVDRLALIGARSANTLVQNVRRTVIPVCNLLKKDIKLHKGMVIGEAGYAKRNREFGTPEVGEVMARLELGSAGAFECDESASADSAVYRPAHMDGGYVFRYPNLYCRGERSSGRRIKPAHRSLQESSSDTGVDRSSPSPDRHGRRETNSHSLLADAS